jgi:flagellar basal-body rod protein FlgB
MLTKVLDATALRHRVIAHNLANVNTPQFHRQYVDFEAELADAVKKGGAEGVANMQLAVKTDNVSPERWDGNNVQLETELSTISENSLQYQTAMQILNIRMQLQRMGITGRS